MCGRIVQATSPEEIAREFGADLSVGVRESLSTPATGDTSLVRAGWYPRWNMAPSSRILMVAPAAGPAGESRVVEYGRWGLVPAWQKARTGHVSGLFNARAETVAQLPSFKEAYRHGRVLVPAEFAAPGQDVKGALVVLDSSKRLRWAIAALPDAKLYQYKVAFDLIPDE